MRISNLVQSLHLDEDFQLEEQEHENAESDGELAPVVEKGKRRKKTSTVELPAPPEFQPLSRQEQEHRAFIRLPTPFDFGDPAPISLFRLFFTDTILNTIVANTNVYALSKDAGSVGRVWTPIDSEDLVVWIALTVYQGIGYVHVNRVAIWMNGSQSTGSRDT